MENHTVTGRVYVSFVVEKDGSITNVHVVKGMDEDYNERAIACVRKMPNWVAAEHGNEKVRSQVSLPIHFELQ